MFRQISIHNKLALALTGAALLAFAVAGAALMLFGNFTLEHRARQIMAPYAQLVSVGAEAAVAFEDSIRAREILDTLRVNPQILEAEIVLPNGRLLAGYGSGADATFRIQPLKADGIYLTDNAAELMQSLEAGAHLRLIMSLEELNRQTQIILLVFAAGEFILLVATALGLRAVLQRTIVRPIAKLAETVEQVRTLADYRQRVPAAGADDVARLGQSFNAMMAGIQEREDELRRLTLFQRTILDNAACGIISTTPEGIVTSFNPAAERLLGYTANEVVGKVTPACWHDPQEIARRARQLSDELGVTVSPGFDVFVASARRNLPAEDEWTFVRKDGTRIPVLLSVTALRVESGQITGLLGLTYDLTERKRAEESLKQSEEMYRSLFEAIPSPFYYKDCDGRFIGCNIAFACYLGIGRDEIIGRTAYDIQPKELAAVSSAVDKRLIDHPGTLVYEAKVGWADGSLRDVIFHKATFTGADGGLAGIAGLILDITERKAAEDQLRKLSLVVEQSPESIVITNVDGEIEYVNEAFVKNSGYSRAEAIGKNPRILNSGNTTRETYASLWGALIDGRPWKGEFHNRRKDGSEYLDFSVITPIRESDGHITHYVAINEDITEKKRMGEELDRHRHHLEELVASRTAQLAEAREQADAANEAKSAFLANMSHEIRTPLNAVLGLARIGMRSNQGRDTGQTYVRILESGEHLLGVINDILDFSKLAAGKLNVERRPFALLAVIDNVKSFVAVHQVEAKGLSLVVSLAPDLHAWVEGDSMRLAQILTNLLSNAIKFTKSGEVRLCAARDGDKVYFRVVDSGIGMSEDQLARLFQSFEQADSSTTRNYGGTGLGLAISQSLAHLMGGDISVDSRPGAGSAFTLELPLPAAAVPAHFSQPGGAINAAGPRLTGLSVLAADDVEVNRFILEDLLTHEGARVVFAHDGQQALEQIDDVGANTFDVVLMDVQMPVMDGIEAARRIATIAPELPVIGLTAHALAEERDKCLAAGMVEHVTKPIDTDTLVAAILRHVRLGVSALNASAPPTSAPLPPPTPVAGLIDHASLLTRFKGRRAFIARLAASVRNHHSATSAKLREAAHAGNLETLAFIAHSLKGVAGNLNIGRLRDAAQALESAAKDERDDMRTLAEQLADVMEATLNELAGLEIDGEISE